jgi:single-strand DNA-binding protein
MNKIILVGRLTKDPELKTTSTTGTSVTNFTVAVNRNYKNKDGKYDADFLPCVAYRATADFVNKFFKKGNLISVEGRVQVRNYDAQDGTKRYVTEVIVENVEFVGGKNENTSGSGNNGYYPDSPIQEPSQDIPEVDVSNSNPYENYDNGVVLSDNDLPF